MDFGAWMTQAQQPGTAIFIRSERGKLKLTSNGFLYSIGKEAADHTIYYCEERRTRKCTGALHYKEGAGITIKREHNHQNNFKKVEAELRKVTF